VRHALRAARATLLPKRTLRHYLTAEPPAGADPFRRGMPAAKPRGKIVGAVVGVTLTIASLASLISV